MKHAHAVQNEREPARRQHEDLWSQAGGRDARTDGKNVFNAVRQRGINTMTTA